MSVINTSIVSISGSRKRTKENVRVESLIPSQLRESSAVLIELLRDYYDYMNKHDNPSYEIDSINNVRDIDTPYHDYLDQIQKEIAAALPGIIVADKVKLYKNLVQYYKVRGSSDSIELFFKIIFQDNVEVYYPREDILIPSSGRWDLQSRKPARVPLFDQRQPISFKMVVEPDVIFKPGESISNTLGTTATVSSQVEDVLTLTGIKIPSKTNFVDIKLLGYQTCSFDTSNNRVTFLSAHGFSVGDRVSFSSVDSGVISGTTGIILNGVYFVINVSTNYFSLSLTLSGSPVDIIASSVGGNISGSVVKLPEYDTFSKFNLKNASNAVIGTAQARALEPTKLYLFDINIEDSYVFSNVRKYGNFAETPNATAAIIKQESVPATYNGFVLGEKVTSSFIEINLVPDLNNTKIYRTNEIVLIENESNAEIAACEVLNFSNADSKLVCKIVRGSLSDASLAKRVVSNEDKSFAFTCTFKESTNTVTFANHGFVNGDQISFSLITNTTGIQINTLYYIINKTDNTFKLSLTSGGSAIALLKNGIGSAFKKCSFTASSDLVTMTSHGFLNGDQVRFKTINSTTVIVANTFYYVISSGTNTFSLSLVSGGPAINLTIDGTGTIDRTISPGAIRTINSNAVNSNYGIRTNESLVRSIYLDNVTSFVFELGRTSAVYSPGERVTGSVSGAFATVLSYDISNLQNKILKVVNPSKKFKINEQITVEQIGDISTIIAMYVPGNYIDNNGFLSDDKKIQDSYYYQQFSYVVKTGLELKSWKNEFNRLVHPAGFIFFSDMLILLKLLDDGLTGQVTKQNRISNRFPEDTELLSRSEYDPLKAGLTKWLASKMTGYQPGMIRLEDIHLLVLSQVVIDTHYIITDETLADNFADNSYFIPGEIVEGSVSGIQAEVQTYDSIKYYTSAQDTQRLGTEGIGTNPGNNGGEQSDQSCNFEFVQGGANNLVRFTSLQPHRLWLEDTVVFSSLSSSTISVRENISGTDTFVTTTLVEKTPYYVVGVTDYTIKISKTLRGFPIEFLSSGTGLANIEYVQKKYGHTVLHKLKLPTSAMVSFTAPTNTGGAVIAGYTVTATPIGGGTAVTATGTSSPINVTGLTNGTAYTFFVVAANSVGTPIGTTTGISAKISNGPSSLGVKNFFEGETLTGLSSGTQKVITSDIQYEDNSGQIRFLNLGTLSSGNNPVPYKLGETVTIRDSGGLAVGTAEVLAYNHSTARIALHKLQGIVQTATSITGEFTRAARSITSVTKGAYRIPRSGKAAWDQKLISTILLGLVAENSNHLNRLKSQYSKQLKFFDNTPISDYSHYVIENDINNDIPWNNVGTFITTY